MKKRGYVRHVQPAAENQTPPLDKTSFAIGFALSSTQYLIGDFATSVQVPAHVITSGVAAFLSGSGQAYPFRAFDNVPGLRGQATEGNHAMEPLALAGGTHENGAEPLKGRRTMSAAAKRRIGEATKKRWARQKREAKGGRQHRNGFWEAEIIKAMGDKSLLRTEIYSVLHKQVGGDKGVIYPSVGSAIKNGLLVPVPGQNNTYKLSEAAMQKATAAAAGAAA